MNELLPVIDSMELGINASQSAQDIESLREGMDLTLKKLFDCLEKFGVKAIDPVGEKFDPDWHEARLHAGTGRQRSGPGRDRNAEGL